MVVFGIHDILIRKSTFGFWLLYCRILWFSRQYKYISQTSFLISDPEDNTTAKSVSYESLARIAWSIALTVQIFACQAGFGGK